jgi:hypothetical protein
MPAWIPTGFQLTNNIDLVYVQNPPEKYYVKNE